LRRQNINWLRDDDVVSFINSNNYDLRKSGNGRWIDQKCAADVVTVVCDCISQYVENNSAKFTSSDIWHYKYTVENVESVFKKPSPDEEKAVAEYNKFFMQPMEMLAYSGVLSKTKEGRLNIYSVVRKDLLEYLALREKNTPTATYTVEKLFEAKALHEKRVEESLRKAEFNYEILESICKSLITSDNSKRVENYDYRILQIKEKIIKNELVGLENNINTGLNMVTVVEDYIKTQSFSWTIKLNNTIKDIYFECVEKGMTPVNIFYSMWDEICGRSIDFNYRHAGLSVLVYFFEKCEVFKK
jgi:hypothetical protein